MSLIKCPECGQDVSDNAKTCPHCGKKISSNSRGSPSQNYNNLDETVKNRLIQEFISSYPAYDYRSAHSHSERNKKFALISSTVGWISFVVFIIIAIVVSTTDTKKIYILIIGLIGIFGALMGATCFFIFKALSTKDHRRYLLTMRIYQAWLHRDKNIIFQAAFDKEKERDRKYFENIPIEMYLNDNKGE